MSTVPTNRRCLLGIHLDVDTWERSGVIIRQRHAARDPSRLAPVCRVKLFAHPSFREIPVQDLDLSTELMSTMKVQVCLKTAEKDSATSKFEVHVSSTDTVGSVKEKVTRPQDFHAGVVV